METPNLPAIRALRPAWNKGRIVGALHPQRMTGIAVFYGIWKKNKQVD